MAVSNQILVRKQRKALKLLNERKYSESRAVCEEILRQRPEDARAWSIIGTIEARCGQPAAAANCMRSAIKADPGLAEAWFGYGQVLELGGWMEDAHKAYLKALSIQPRMAEAHAALGRICLEEWSLFRDAIRHLRSALDIGQLRPELMAAYQISRQKLIVTFGEALRAGGELKEAMKVLRSALDKQPNDTELLQRIGNLHIGLSQFDEAHRCFRRAIELAPDNLFLRVCEIRTLRLEKRIDEALDLIQPLFASAANNFDIVMSYAKLCHHAGECRNVIARLEEMEQSGRLKTQQKMLASYELGRLYDAVGEYDKAFEWYRRGNDIKRGGYDRAGAETSVSAVIESYSREHLATAARARNTDRRPLFIVGMPRSGTSLIEQILASHPQVYGAGELTDVLDLLRGHRQDRSGSALELVRTECQSFTTDALDRMAKQYLDHIGGISEGETIVTDKMPSNCFRLGAISLMLPKARIIHCRRNAIDTCLSCYFQNFTGYHPYSNDFGSLAAFYRDYLRIMAHWKEVIDLPILEVDYEALVADQQAETRRMLDFLGLDWDQRCLEYYQTDRPTVTASHDQVNRPIYATSVARWKHYEEHIAPLIELLEDVLDGESPA